MTFSRTFVASSIIRRRAEGRHLSIRRKGGGGRSILTPAEGEKVTLMTGGAMDTPMTITTGERAPAGDILMLMADTDTF